MAAWPGPSCANDVSDASVVLLALTMADETVLFPASWTYRYALVAVPKVVGARIVTAFVAAVKHSATTPSTFDVPNAASDTCSFGGVCDALPPEQKSMS